MFLAHLLFNVKKEKEKSKKKKKLLISYHVVVIFNYLCQKTVLKRGCIIVKHIFARSDSMKGFFSPMSLLCFRET